MIPYLQLRVWLMIPPNTGPIAGPAILTAENKPTYPPLSSGVAISPMQPLPIAMTAEPPVA
jgi:hypothetical protein